MFVLCLKIEMHIPHATSLKQKRQSIKSMIDRISAKYNVSISEVDHHDLWQRSSVGISYVSKDTEMISKIETKLMAIIYDLGEVEVTKVERELLKI